MKPSSKVIRTATCLMCLILLAPAAMADDKYVKSQEPVFPEVQPDRALVYFARPDFMHLIPNPTFKVFVDDTPAGWLPQRSYLAVQVDPGSRVVWGPSNDAQRFDFQAGKTYLLILVERYGSPNRMLLGTSWLLGDPADVRALVAAKKLSYVTPTEEAMAKLREEGANKFGKQQRKAPVIAAATLPATFETVWYRPGKRGFSFKAYDATGTLTVDKEKIEFRSDKKTLVISVKDIQSLSLDRIGSGLSTFDRGGDWGIVRYGAPGSAEVAAFRDGRGLGTGRDTEQIYLTLRSVVEAAPSAANQSFGEQPPREGRAPEEEVVVSFDPRKWHVGYETEKGSQRIKEFVLPGETVDNWTELVTVQSFPDAQKRMTAKETALGMKQQLLNECPKAMWSVLQGDEDQFLYEWQTVDCPGWDNQYEVSKVIRGRTAIHRIAYANRKLPIAEETRRQWTDLIGKTSYQAPVSDAQPSQARPAPQSVTADNLPEGFVLYKGMKDQFTIAIPQGWGSYDQAQTLKGAPGLLGLVFFLPAESSEVLEQQHRKPGGWEEASEVFTKVGRGELPSFTVERVPADAGMSCTGFSEKAEKRLLKTVGRDPAFGKKGSNVLEPPHADPTTVGSCKALRIRARGQTPNGLEWVTDMRAASDGQTLYMFYVRTLAENYAKNLVVFEKAISTAKLAAAK